MPSLHTIPWNQIPRLPKEHLITVAWAHVPDAADELGEYARLQLSRSPHLAAWQNGDLDAAPRKAVTRALLQALKEEAVAPALVCLWADARKGFLDLFRHQAATLAHVQFKPGWSWQSALSGVVIGSPLLDESIQEAFRRLLLDRVTREGIAGTDRDFVLACYWLSSAVNLPWHWRAATRLPTGELMTMQAARFAIPRPIAQEGMGVPGSVTVRAVSPQEPAEAPAVPPAPESAPTVAPIAATSPVELPNVEDATDAVTEHSPDVADPPLPLITLRQQVHAQRMGLLHTSEQIQSVAGNVAKVARQLDVQQTQAQVDALSGLLQQWKDQAVTAAEVQQAVSERLAAEAVCRPGVAAAPYTVQPAPDRPGDSSSSVGVSVGISVGATVNALAQLADYVDAILTYDTQRAGLLASLAQQRSMLSEQRATLVAWREGEIEQAAEEEQEAEETDAAEPVDLAQLRNQLQQAQRRSEELAAQLRQLQQTQYRQIEELIGRLADLALAPKSIVYQQVTLAEVQQGIYRDWPPRQLAALRQTLSGQVDRLLLEQKASSVAAQAAEFNETWAPATLVHLLEALAKQKLDAEALLLLLATNVTRPMSQLVELPASCVRALLAGFEQLAGEPGGVELLALLAPEFLLGWRPQDMAGRTQLCVALAVAELTAGMALPEGILWQVASEWPNERMPVWHALWADLLRGAKPQFSDGAEADQLHETLARTHQAALHSLDKDGGFYARVRTLNNRRYAQLLNQRLLPVVDTHFAQLAQVEAKAQAASPDQVEPVRRQLTRLLATLRTELAPDALEESFERAMQAEKIDDHPHLRPAAFLILQRCADALLAYADALDQALEGRLRLERTIDRTLLAQELDREFEHPVPIAQTFAGRRALAPSTKSARTHRHVLAEGLERVLPLLLSQPTYALRLPGVVGHLTAHPATWAALQQGLLYDLAHPPATAQASADRLLQAEAPSQALLLAAEMTVEQQTRAQQLLDHFERKAAQLQSDLAAFDQVEIDDLLTYRQYGRWRLLLAEMETLLELAQEERQQQEQMRRDRGAALLERTHPLQLRLFQEGAEMPALTYQAAHAGIITAQQMLMAHAFEGLLAAVEQFLAEMEYQFDHRTWPLEKLQQMHRQLTLAASGQGTAQREALTPADVLSHFEHDDLLPLGIASLEPSSIETRTRLLEAWQRVKAIRSLLPTEMLAAEREAIATLYDTFTKLVSLRAKRSVRGKPLFMQEPIYHRVYELVYPRHVLLEQDCVLIALTGDPPSAEHLRQVEQLIDENDWLQDRFVLLLMPGGAPKLKDRLQARYEQEGLVLLDDAALVAMVLAEADQRNPLGHLRSYMLNAADTGAGADIFKINQLVKARTAIFVGREPLLRKILTTSNNYALYGGRRIGKSSILAALEDRLTQRQHTSVCFFSFEGRADCSDAASARLLARELGLGQEIQSLEDFKFAVQAHLEEEPDRRIAILLDEIDKYILDNPKRHLLIESLRALSDHYADRFRVIVAGFMALYGCLQGRGPYTPTSDPWRRMLDDIGPVPNLSAGQAEEIVKEGFRNILGWRFEGRLIPPLIVQRTGGHPAFVQSLCMKLQERVARRRDQTIRTADVEAVFEDNDPEHSFIAYVKKTLEMNLDPLGRFLILLIAGEAKDARRFTFGQLVDYARMAKTPLPLEDIRRSLEQLKVTSVVRESQPEVYEFTVPEYPLILSRLGETRHLDELERMIEHEYEGRHAGR